MSIAALQELETELRRFATLPAEGDFRAEHLIEPIRTFAGEDRELRAIASFIAMAYERGSPICSRILIELATRTRSVLATNADRSPTEKIPETECRQVIETLSTTGAGRLKIVERAIIAGYFDDARLIGPAIAALDDPCAELADLIARHVLPACGATIATALETQLDICGGQGDVRRLRILGSILGTDGRRIYERALEHGSKEVRAEAVRCLSSDESARTLIVDAVRDRARDVRAEAIKAIGSATDDRSIDALIGALRGPAVTGATIEYSRHEDTRVRNAIAAEARSALGTVVASPSRATRPEIERATWLVKCLNWHPHDSGRAFLGEAAGLLKRTKRFRDLHEQICHAILQCGDDTARDALGAAARRRDAPAAYEVEIAIRQMTPIAFFEEYSDRLTATRGRARAERDAVERNLYALAMRLTDDPRWHKLHLDDRPRFWSVWDRTSQWLEPISGADARWLDAAINANRPFTVAALARPEHTACVAYLTSDHWRNDRSAIRYVEEATKVRLLGLARARDPRFESWYFRLATDRHCVGEWMGAFAHPLSVEGRSRLDTIIGDFPTDTAAYVNDVLRRHEQHTP